MNHPKPTLSPHTGEVVDTKVSDSASSRQRFAFICVAIAWVLGTLIVEFASGNELGTIKTITPRTKGVSGTDWAPKPILESILRRETIDAVVTSRIDGLLQLEQNRFVVNKLEASLHAASQERQSKTQRPSTSHPRPNDAPHLDDKSRMISVTPDALQIDPVLDVMPVSRWITKTAYREMDRRFRMVGLRRVTMNRLTLDMARQSAIPGLMRLMSTISRTDSFVARSGRQSAANKANSNGKRSSQNSANSAPIKRVSETKLENSTVANAALTTNKSIDLVMPVSGAQSIASSPVVAEALPITETQAITETNGETALTNGQTAFDSNELVPTETEELAGQLTAPDQTVGDRSMPARTTQPVLPPVQTGLPRGRNSQLTQQPQPEPPVVRVAQKWPMGDNHNPQSGVTLNVENTDVRSVLEMLARGYNMNILVSPDVQGVVTANVEGLTPDQALQGVLKMCDLRAQVDHGVIYVYPAAKMPDDSRIVRHFALDFARAEEIEPTVQGLVSPIGRAYVSKMDAADNLRTREAVVVVDTLESLARIENYIMQVDRPPRQVMIEARILEVELTDDMQHGVNFDSILRGDLSVGAFGLAEGVASRGNPLFFAQIDGNRIQAVVDMLETTTDAKTLATPKVMVVNGQNARIQVGQQLGFTVATVTQTSTIQDVQFLETGVVLSVTPTISRDDQIMMQVKPEVSNGQINPDTLLPEEETRELETSVLLNNHQGVVIGGLIQENDRTVIRKLPWLGDVKHVGKLFQRREEIRSRSEIIIALIPHIINMDEHPERDHLDRDKWHMDYDRTNGPLLYGPLNRNCRPWEPRLPDVYRDSSHLDVNRVNQMIP